MRSIPVKHYRSRSRRSQHLARNCFRAKAPRHQVFCGDLLVLDSVANQDIPVVDCPEELGWLPRSIRNIFNAIGIRKRADATDAANQVTEKLKEPIKPVLDLLAHGVQEITFFVREAVLCVKVVWNTSAELVLYGPTSHFFA